MNYEEFKDILYNLITEYFAGAGVKYMEDNEAKPSLPLVTLKLGTLSFANSPIEYGDEADNRVGYPCEAMLEMQAYTKGRSLRIPGYSHTTPTNTAIGDLMEFVKYIGSPYFLNKTEKLGVSVLTASPIRDLTGLLNNNKYEYRAMLELQVGYIADAMGMAGITPSSGEFAQTATGGGTEELAAMMVGDFEKVSITDQYFEEKEMKQHEQP